MKTILKVLVVFLLFSSASAHAGCMDTNEGSGWKAAYPDIYNKLMGLMTCSADGSDPTACNVFVAKASELLFHVTDFKKADNVSYMSANDIADFVRSDPAGNWSKLGNADTQSVLDEAAAGAQDHLIIATLKGNPHGHVAIVLPGEEQNSGTWNLMVPNSAAFTLDNADKAYVFCKLSWAFTDPSQVEIWWRPAIAP